MSSKNLGEQEGKPDYGLIFDDFPHCWADFPHELALINNDYKALFNIALSKITIEDLQKAREYGCRKYDRFNFIQSRGTTDHANFMFKNRRSIYRHLVALRRDDIDADSGCLHWAMVALRCMIAIEYSHLDVVMETSDPVLGEYGFQGNRLTGEPLDILLESEQKKTIYDWSKIDKAYNWCAKNFNDSIFIHITKPTKYQYAWLCSEPSIMYKGEPFTELHWEKSLEARPT